MIRVRSRPWIQSLLSLQSFLPFGVFPAQRQARGLQVYLFPQRAQPSLLFPGKEKRILFHFLPLPQKRRGSC